MHDQSSENVGSISPPPDVGSSGTPLASEQRALPPPVFRGLTLCLMGTGLLFLSLGPLLLGAGTASPPGLEVEGAADIWIDRVESNDIAHEFLLVNRSGEPIRITDVHRSCTCTVAKLPEDRVIAPGERVPVEVVFSPGGRYGRLQETVRFATDFPSTPVVQISLGGLVPPDPQVSYRPHLLWFSTSDAERTIYLVVPKLPGYTEPQIWKQTPWIEASVEQLEETEKYTQYAVEVRLADLPETEKSALDSDHLEGTFGISLGKGADQFLQIPVVFRRVPLESSPSPVVGQSVGQASPDNES